MKILVTGGAGYIGSHTCLELLQAGHDVLVLDNYSNSNDEPLKRVMDITGRQLRIVEGDVRDRALLDKLFADNNIDSVVHFAGSKAVGESTQIPLAYYDNNVYGSLVLLQAMQDAGVFSFVFSSSATVYGEPEVNPITETAALNAMNPYGRTKLMVEDICRDLAASDERWRISLLRYFNPAGAHPSGRIGEQPNGIPNNLVPYITQVAIGQRDYLSVFGADYDTPDGTGVRDYLHVVDLAIGHLKALEQNNQQQGCFAYNLGTGQGYSVLDIVKAFERAAKIELPYQITARRPGDIACYYGDPSLAKSQLGWQAERGLDEMMLDAWRWQSENPNGYQ